MFTLPLQPGVPHSQLLVVMETERWAGSWVAGFMLDFFELAVCAFGLWDQGPVSGSLALPTGNAARRPTGPGAPNAGGLAAVIGAEELSIGAAAVVTVHLMPAAGRPNLSQGVHAVTLPQLHTHSVLLQLAFRAATAGLTFGVALALYALLEVCAALWTLVGTRHELLARRAAFLIAGFGVAGFDLVLLSLALLPSVLGRRTGAGASAYGAPATTALITAGPGTPARPASVHSAGLDVTEAMLQVSSQDVCTPRAVGAGTEEGSDPLLLTHSAGPRTGAPFPPLCPRAVPPCTVWPHTYIASI